MPVEYTAAINGMPIGPRAGSCGTAAWTARRVVVADIASDPLWADYKHLARAHGLVSCWSEPIIDHDGSVLGTFAFYSDRIRAPTPEELKQVEDAGQIAAAFLGHASALEGKRRSDDRLRSLFDTTKQWLAIVGADGTIVELNQTALADGPRDHDELLGRPLWEAPAWAPHARDRQRLQSAIRRAAAGEFVRYSATVQHSAREQRLIDLTISPIQEGERVGSLVVEGLDTTELLEALEALRVSEERYRTLIESTHDLVQQVATDGRIKYVNRAWLETLGYSEEDVEGLNIWQIVAPEEIEHCRELFRRVIDGEHVQGIRTRWIRRDGRRILVEGESALHTDERGAASTIGFFRDVTRQVATENELRTLTQDLERRVEQRTHELGIAKRDAEQADLTKSAFLASMSHELRTPLNSILGFTGILASELAGPVNAEQSRQLGMVQSSARHLLSLINDVLDISRIEAGKLDVRSEVFDLAMVCRQALGSLAPQAEAAGLELRWAIPGGCLLMRGDAQRTEQVLINLVGNAVKFTERGWVELRLESAADAVVVEVEDTGPGIPPGALEMLFERFVQVSTGTARRHQGSGLGLAISRRLVELMGGELTCQSEVARGSSFRLRLPIEPAAKDVRDG